ncbi:MAG TPA: hypothetical protein VGY31_01640 [Terriglobia bacterium]|nr:hypothetical protein [Terriglobia bacterium]
MAISRTYTINGFTITVSATGTTGVPAGVLAVNATASYTPPAASSTPTSAAPAATVTPITVSDALTFDPTQPPNQALSQAQMQLQVESFLQVLANRLATLIMLNNTFQQVT